MPLRGGGGGGPLRAKAIKNFHFDFLTTSLIPCLLWSDVLLTDKHLNTSNPSILNWSRFYLYCKWQKWCSKIFFFLARSQVIYYVLNIGVLHPYQHVKHYNIDYAARRNIECFWSSICSHWYSYLASFSSSSCLVLSRVPAWLVLTYCSNSFSRSMLTTIVAGNKLRIPISISYADR